MRYLDYISANDPRLASLTPANADTRSRASFDKVFSEELVRKQVFDKAVAPLLESNRRYVDGRNPMKFGILQSTLKDYDPQGRIASDVRNLDESGARQIYRKIWDRSGCEALPEPLGTMHFYSFVHRPQAAAEALKRSDLDPLSYVTARRDALSRTKGYVQDLNPWDRRIEALASDASRKETPADKGLLPVSRMTTSLPESPIPRSLQPYKQMGRFDRAFAFVARQEGSALVRNDNGRGPSRFGILQSTLREYDPQGKIARHVKDLNESGARQIYRKIWDRAGCEDLSYPLSVVHFDTYVHRPKTAVESLRASKGDVELYLRNRKTDLMSLKSYRKFGGAWEGRMERLLQFVRNGDMNASYLKA